ncbi:MAG: phosphoglycerate kinase [Coriobacteriales bacterium]|jgi:phosphoglycerate kinase
MKSIRDVDVAGKRVIMRVDFNVPMSKEGTVTEDKRIRGALPTIQYLLDNGARIVLASHLGRPSGKGFEAAYSMVPAARVLSRLIGKDVKVVPVVTGEKAVEASKALADGEIMMVENLRFDAREKKNAYDFARELSELGDIYVDNAFGCAHRSHASIDAITHFLPSYSGFLLEEEVKTLTGVVDNPVRPFMAILGGAKVSDKIALVDRMLDNVDVLIIGGGMCFTFLRAKGLSTGTSLVEQDWIQRAGEMLAKAERNGVKLLLPVDFVVADMLQEDAATAIRGVDEIPDDMMGLDIGPATCELFAREIAAAKTIVWNGPMGVFEMKPFEDGTRKVAEALAANTEATTVVGGGDSAAAAAKFGVEEKMTFISTGGGASMQLLEGTPLPGVVALDAQD